MTGNLSSCFRWRGCPFREIAPARFESSPLTVFGGSTIRVERAAQGDCIASVIVEPDVIQGRGDTYVQALDSLALSMEQHAIAWEEGALRLRQFLAESQ